MKQELCTTTDIIDDLLSAGRWLSRQNLDDMMAYCASLGAKRHEWILDTVWNIYDSDSPFGFDLLRQACESAHRHGMRFDVIFKPFEGALGGDLLPPTLPKPANVPFLQEETGIFSAVRPFVARHPEMRLERNPADLVDPGGPITAIRLVNHGKREAGFDTIKVDIQTSESCDTPGSDFTPYSGPVDCRQEIEYRPVLPYNDSSCQVIKLENLNLPEKTKFIRLSFSGLGEECEFKNEAQHLVEIVNQDGQIIPSSLTPRVATREQLDRFLSRSVLGTTRYLSHPLIRSLLQDEKTFLSHWQAAARFKSKYDTVDGFRVKVDNRSELVVSRGMPRYVSGALNPVYPEVREDWLEHLRFCIERGVDGVNIRTGSHNKPVEPWVFGFNPPTLNGTGHRQNSFAVASVNGEAYTRFLRDAASLLHQSGKQLGVHVDATMLRPDERKGMWWPGEPVPRNIHWQWETWVSEIVDFVEFRGSFMLRPENLAAVADRIGMVAEKAGKPFIYQSSRSQGVVSFDGPYRHLTWEIGKVRQHPDITGYNLYETANFTRINKNGDFEGSDEMARMIEQNWRKP